MTAVRHFSTAREPALWQAVGNTPLGNTLTTAPALRGASHPVNTWYRKYVRRRSTEPNWASHAAASTWIERPLRPATVTAKTYVSTISAR